MSNHSISMGGEWTYGDDSTNLKREKVRQKGRRIDRREEDGQRKN